MSPEALASASAEIPQLISNLSRGLTYLEVALHNSRNNDSAKDLSELETLNMSLPFIILTNLNSSKFLLDRGLVYESQVITRTAFETLHLLVFMYNKPHKAEKLYNSTFPQNGRIFDFMFSKLIKVLPEEQRLHRQELYSWFCKFSHPTGMAFFSYAEMDGKNFQSAFYKFSFSILLAVLNLVLDELLSISLISNQGDVDQLRSFLSKSDSHVIEYLRTNSILEFLSE